MTFFFFQAEDGIRDKLVTGVQTCALPICEGRARGRALRMARVLHAAAPRLAVRAVLSAEWRVHHAGGPRAPLQFGLAGSGERRVGEEGRSRGAPDHLKKKKRGMVRR